MAANPLVALRRRLNPYFDDDAPQTRPVQVFNFLLAVLIVVNIAAVIAESVQSIQARYADAFWAIERVATAVFAIEYGLRAWTAVDRVSGAFRHPLWGRLKYLHGFFALVDLAAILPAVLGVLGAPDLRVLRLLRLLRMLKLTRHSKIFLLIWAVLRDEAQAIGAVLFVLCFILILSGSLMYMIEGEAQPEVFSSIPVSMWWAVETVTTVGYGDMVPVTALGRILGTLISVAGILSFAVFSGIVTVGIMDQMKLRREHYQRLLERRLAEGTLHADGVKDMAEMGERMGLAGHEVAATVATVIKAAPGVAGD